MALRFSQISPLAKNLHSDGGGNVATGVALTEDYEAIDECDLVPNCSEVELGGADSKEQPATSLSHLGISFRLFTPCSPLKIFLHAKKRALESEGKGEQAAVIVLWLIELLLGEISLCEDKCAKSDPPAVRLEELTNVRNEFRALVTSSKVLVSFGRTSSLSLYTI